ncbi:MAG: NAD(P)H-hydrate epimerase, partial [Paracoccaceae bacterium]
AIDSGEVTGLKLMERAGRGVVAAIFEQWPSLAAGVHRAVVICGPGNNGGDGFVVARVLNESGWRVEVFLYGAADKLPADAKVNYERWRKLAPVGDASGGSAPAHRAKLGADLIVDAVFGTGLARPVDDPDLWEWFRLIENAPDVADPGGTKSAHPQRGEWQPMRTVAVDIPSGLSADTGEVIGGLTEHGLRAPRVMLTVTFHAAKRGHLRAEGPEHCGHLVVCDIGLGNWAAAGRAVV